MSGPVWRNVYSLTDNQISMLDMAEDNMEMMKLGLAERILIDMLDDDPKCIPVLNVMAHFQGRYISDFEKAVEYYDRVLELEPDNAWARDARRRYLRYVGRD